MAWAAAWGELHPSFDARTVGTRGRTCTANGGPGGLNGGTPPGRPAPNELGGKKALRGVHIPAAETKAAVGTDPVKPEV